MNRVPVVDGGITVELTLPSGTQCNVKQRFNLIPPLGVLTDDVLLAALITVETEANLTLLGELVEQGEVTLAQTPAWRPEDPAATLPDDRPN